MGNNVFDCRIKDVIKSYMRQEDGSYLVSFVDGITPAYDDFLITKSGDLMVFDYVNDGCGRLLDLDMMVGRIGLSYRKIKRAALAQLKRLGK